MKLVSLWFPDYKLHKPDDHDRQNKGDRVISYKGRDLTIEVKSLQTNSVKELAGGTYAGTFQCDKSDSTSTKLPDGTMLKTVCLSVGSFDLLAINLFEFGQQWRFAFVKNFDLPRSPSRKYTEYQRRFLLKTTPSITWPLQPPYCDEPFALLDDLLAEKKR